MDAVPGVFTALGSVGVASRKSGIRALVVATGGCGADRSSSNAGKFC